MQTLVVGAGAIGGYFGARLAEAGRNVTFLVRARRAEQLRATGLVVRSPYGDVAITTPSLVRASALSASYDLIIVSCKAYDLPDVMQAMAPAVGPHTTLLPLLNGLRHLDALVERFGETAVLGGECMISAVLDEAGVIRHLNDMHLVVFGERGGGRSPRVDAIAATLAGARFDARASEEIMQEMWEKWIFIASLGGINTLMRGTIGEIHAAGGSELARALYDECRAIATAHGFPPRESAVARATSVLTAAGSSLTASLLKDVERGAPTEGAHILDDLYRRGASHGVAAPLLQAVCAHVRTHEVRRGRTAA